MYVHYYAIIIILDENGLRSTILSFIAIISWTIYRPAKFVIVTGLTAINSGRKMSVLGLQSPSRGKCLCATAGQLSFNLIGNPSKKKQKKKAKRARAIYATIANTIICVLYSACVSKHVFICSNAIHNVISNYSLSRQTRIHCASPMRMELVEVLWLSFCSGEPQTCLKECPSRA